MQKLSPADVPQFLERFYSFTDSLVRKAEISYGDGSRSVLAFIAARDSRGVANGGWACVQLKIDGVSDYCFSDEEKTAQQVISDGIHIRWFGSKVAIDFGHFSEPPESLAEAKTSTFFAIGDDLSWELTAY